MLHKVGTAVQYILLKFLVILFSRNYNPFEDAIILGGTDKCHLSYVEAII